MRPHQTAGGHVFSCSLSVEPAELLRGGAVWIPVVPDTYKPSRFGKICFSFAKLNSFMFSSLSCTSELHVLRCKLPSENPSILNSSDILRQGNHCCTEEMKYILNWIDSWICYQVPNNLIIITDLVFMWPLSPGKIDSTQWGRRKKRSPYFINESSQTTCPSDSGCKHHQFFFPVWLSKITGLRFFTWEPLLCLGSSSLRPVPFIQSQLTWLWGQPVHLPGPAWW